MPGFIDRMRLSWRVLSNRLPELPESSILPSYTRPGGAMWRDNSASVLAPIKTRIAIDVANIPFRHVTVDEHGRFIGYRVGELDDRLTWSANIDQTGVSFIQDLVYTMMDEGVAAIVPTETSSNPVTTTSYDILSWRVGVVTEWYNKSVKVSVYNEYKGERVEVVLPKSYVALIQNPLYMIMNEPNSTLKRLVEKRALMDLADSRIRSPNLDLILQLPWAVKTDKRKEEADKRIALLTEQLYNQQYGVAYVDATEKITQLNRPVENTLYEQIKYLTDSLHYQLGLTESVFNGTASEEEELAYHNRTIGPFATAICNGIVSSFLTKTAVRQGQSIMFFQNLFKMAPIEKVADSLDKFITNEVLTSNEGRQMLGFVPSGDPKADELRNRHLNESKDKGEMNDEQTDEPPVKESNRIKQPANGEVK
jgi:hypothetical protein